MTAVSGSETGGSRPKQGGARPGAGRKSLGGVKIWLTVPDDVAAAYKADRKRFREMLVALIRGHKPA